MATRAAVNGFLGPPRTQKYAPKVYGAAGFWTLNTQRPPFLTRYVEQMREDAQIQFGLRAIYGPLARVRAVCSSATSRAVSQYVTGQLKRIIGRAMPALRQCVEYGHAAGEPTYALAGGRLVFERLRDWHPLDCKPMALDGRLVGVQVQNVEGEGRVEVGAPRYVWVANEPRPGSFWGRSRFAPAWTPWMEKVGRNGALDVRRLHFFKNALRGDQIYYPEGQSNVGTDDNPIWVSNQDLARQLGEQMMSGGTLATPGARDASGNREWEVKGPTSTAAPEGLLDWVKDLDSEILKGLGVPPEVLQASGESGSGYAGRAIPLTVFYDSLDELARQVVDAVDKHILRWLVRANFGRKARYEVHVESLAPKPPQPSPGGPGPAGQGVRPNGPPGQPPAPGAGRGKWTPYAGPRGGRGRKYASGRVKYGMSRSDRAWAAEARRPGLRDQVRAAGSNTRHLAAFYAGLWNLFARAGQTVPESELEKAGAELARGRWVVAYDRRRGKWVVYPAGPDEDKVQLSTEHAPVGGVTLEGKFYRGGQFIPSAVVASLPPQERAKLAQAKQAAREGLRSRAAPHLPGLRERLGAHAGEKLDPRQERAAAATLRQLQRHHGDLTRHRLAELAHVLEEALAKTPEDEHGIRGQFRQRLAALHRMEAGLPEEAKPEKPAAPKPGTVATVPTADLHIDPVRFQFKLGTNKEGVGAELKSVKSFKPDLGGILSVWRDPADGKDYVVNGHHRHELASRTGHPDMAVRYLGAKDAKEARAKGALINIAEGRGTPVDAAKFMRDTGYGPDDLAAEGVSLSGAVARDAASLARLSDKLFDRVATGGLDPAKAAAIGAHLGDHGLQDKLAKWIDAKEEKAGREYSPKVVAEMAREIADTPKTTKTESTLWGDETSEESLFGERNELKAHVRGELAKEFKDFQTVASERRAAVVGKAGNVLNVEANKAAATEAGQAKNTFDALANYKGAVSDALNDFAEKYSHAKGQREREAVRRDAVAAVRSALSAAQPPGAGGVGAGGAGARGDEPAAAAAGGGGTGGALTADVSGAGRLSDAAKAGVAPAAAKRAEDYLASLGDGPAPPPAGMVRLYRGSPVGEALHEKAFFADERGLAGVAVPFAKAEGRHLVYVDVPEAVAKAGLLGGAVTEGEYQLPEEYRKQVKPWGEKPAPKITPEEHGRRLEEVMARTPADGKPDPFRHDDPNESESVRKDRIASLQAEHPPSIARDRAAENRAAKLEGRSGPEPARPVAAAAKPEPMPSAAHVTKPEAGGTPQGVSDALEINPGNLEGVYQFYRDQAQASDQKLSPNRAGELAAVRLRQAIRKRLADIDDKARRGKLPPAEEKWYDRIEVEGWSYGRELERLSGSRTMPLDEDHPFASLPLGEAPQGAGRERKAAPELARESAVPESHRPVGGEDADLSPQLGMLAVGELGYVGGFPVRRVGRREYRLETAKHHVTGTMEEVAERVRRQWADQRPERKAVDAALARAAGYAEPHPFTDAAGAARDEHARQNVPAKTRAVSLDPETRGRVGTVVYETDAQGRRSQRLVLDGSPDSHATDFEPLDPAGSWRAGNHPAPSPPRAKQEPLFPDQPPAAPDRARLEAHAARLRASIADAAREPNREGVQDGRRVDEAELAKVESILSGKTTQAAVDAEQEAQDRRVAEQILASGADVSPRTKERFPDLVAKYAKGAGEAKPTAAENENLPQSDKIVLTAPQTESRVPAESGGVPGRDTPGDRPMTGTIRKHSSMRQVDAYHVGAILQHDGRWVAVTDYSRRPDDHGSYEHVLAYRPATEDEAKRGRIAELRAELRSLPSDDVVQGGDAVRASRSAKIDDELRSLEGRPSREAEEVARKAATAAAHGTDHAAAVAALDAPRDSVVPDDDGDPQWERDWHAISSYLHRHRGADASISDLRQMSDDDLRAMVAGEDRSAALADAREKGHRAPFVMPQFPAGYATTAKAAATTADSDDSDAADVRVRGNTYPHRGAIKNIPGAYFRGGSWYVPAGQVGRLPRGLSHD